MVQNVPTWWSECVPGHACREQRWMLPDQSIRVHFAVWTEEHRAINDSNGSRVHSTKGELHLRNDEYQSQLYVYVRTRSDIAIAVSIRRRQVSNPSNADWKKPNAICMPLVTCSWLREPARFTWSAMSMPIGQEIPVIGNPIAITSLSSEDDWSHGPLVNRTVGHYHQPKPNLSL